MPSYSSCPRNGRRLNVGDVVPKPLRLLGNVRFADKETILKRLEAIVASKLV